eukprot:TRINITY_DN5925_c1_g1_i1.p2 TRINITY_DN5925_c1_g1~~TRINITY_DN5925_c1_g1_i1.p2  ORF type:complete len:153 (+),score=59.67 TRINITY_DN5925_c1_g1_i1:54-461(+)
MEAAARAFFDACEYGKDNVSDFMADDATFEAQCEPLAEMKMLKEYTTWMNGLANQTMPGCSPTVHHVGVDKEHKSVSFFATFNGTHTGPGGPCDPTNKSLKAHYVYIITLNDDNKVQHMVKVWNATWSLKELGWM